MDKSLTTSDSIIGSLCREIKQIESRSKVISSSIDTSQNKNLTIRLKNELINLHSRVQSIKELSDFIYQTGKMDSLSMEFLNEIIGRSYIHSTAKEF